MTDKPVRKLGKNGGVSRNVGKTDKKRTTTLDIEVDEDVKRRVLRLVKGETVAYRKELHLPLMINIFKIGGTREKFCSKAEISQNTFYDWLKKYPEFAATYQEAHLMAWEWWQENCYGIDYKIWESIMRNRFRQQNYCDAALPGFMSDKPVESMRAVKLAIGEGKITLREAVDFAKVVSETTNAITHEQLEERVAALEAKDVTTE